MRWTYPFPPGSYMIISLDQTCALLATKSGCPGTQGQMQCTARAHFGRQVSTNSLTTLARECGAVPRYFNGTLHGVATRYASSDTVGCSCHTCDISERQNGIIAVICAALVGGQRLALGEGGVTVAAATPRGGIAANRLRAAGGAVLAPVRQARRLNRLRVTPGLTGPVSARCAAQV